jgi:hypothetical protein
MRYSYKSWRQAACAVVLSVLMAGCGLFGEEEETFHPPQGEGPWILADLYHSRLQNHEDYRLEKGNYNYQGAYGYHRAFEHLTDNGYQWRSIRTLPLSQARLEGFDVLFINLVDENRPDFTTEEHRLIVDWVEDGGGLFVIADHTNVYYHAQRINPFLEPMGIEVGYHTALDEPPEYSVAGTAWIMVFDFASHWVTRGVEMVSLQTGGPIFGDHGVGFTSDDSFGDYWDESSGTGFYGNWRHDGDDALEPRGPLPVVAAREYGQGRVVVVGDQNIFGDAWLHFGNNFELFMNSIQWLAGLEDEPPLRASRLSGLNIGVELVYDEFGVGRNTNDGYYVFFVNLNRDSEVSASGRMGINPDDDVLMLMQPSIRLDRPAVERVRNYFEQGKTVVLSFEADSAPEATIELLTELAPDFSVTVDGQQHQLSELAAGHLSGLEFDHVEAPLAIESDALEVDGLEVATQTYPHQTEPDDLSHYLLEISSEWGDPFITAEAPGGATLDIARRKEIADGELIVFLQDGFWRNRTLGNKETEPPSEEAADAVELQFRLLDYLKETAH